MLGCKLMLLRRLIWEKWQYYEAQFLHIRIPKEYGKHVTAKSEGPHRYSFPISFFCFRGWVVCRILTAARCHTCQFHLRRTGNILLPNLFGNNMPKAYGKQVTAESDGSRGYSFQYRFFDLEGGWCVAY